MQRSTKVLHAMILITISLAVLHVALQFINLVIFNEKNGWFYELSNRWDFDDENSLPTWYSQAILLSIGVSSLVASFLDTSKIKRATWRLLAALGLILSIDEVSGIHELVLQAVHLSTYKESAPTLFSNAWVLLLPIILMAVGYIGYRIARVFPRSFVRLCALGAAVFLSGAVFVDIVTQSMTLSLFESQGLLVALEESLEIMGSTIILYAILRYIETSFTPVIIKINRVIVDHYEKAKKS